VGTVEHLRIAPKQDIMVHRRVQYTLTFVPAVGKWSWSFSIVQRTRYDGMCDTYDAAKTAARLHIDLAQGAPP
jgi:hypothetical protein